MVSYVAPAALEKLRFSYSSTVNRERNTDWLSIQHEGALMVRSFEASLRRMRYSLQVENLLIKIREFAFGVPNDYTTFAWTISRTVRVTKSLEIEGDMTYQALFYDGLAQLLNLRPDPVPHREPADPSLFSMRYIA